MYSTYNQPIKYFLATNRIYKIISIHFAIEKISPIIFCQVGAYTENKMCALLHFKETAS